MDDVQYTQYYVAFLDILGFKNLISNSQFSCRDIYKIYEAFEPIQKVYYGKEYGETQDIKIKIMSDSICLYIEADKSNSLRSLVSFCVAFQYDLLTISPTIFVRGGITFGDMYINDDIIFGPALTEAYLLEEKNAKVPRIIIRKETLDYGKKSSDDESQKILMNCTFRDDDAFYTLDYFKLLFHKPGNEKIRRQVEETVSRFLDTVVDESIRQKYLYVEKHIRKYLEEKTNA